MTKHLKSMNKIAKFYMILDRMIMFAMVPLDLS